MANTEAVFRPASPPKVDLPATLEHDLVVFPREISDEGMGLYDGALVDLVKVLRSDGVDASYMHPSDQRQWIGEKGFTPNELSVIIGIPVAVVGAAFWDALKSPFEKAHSKRKNIRLTVGRYTSASDGSTTQEWLEAEGSSEDIVKAIEALRGTAEPPQDSK